MPNIAVVAGSVVIGNAGPLHLICGKLAITGNYPGSNGDIFDPSVLFSQYKSAPKQPLFVFVEGTADWDFKFIPGATLGAGKLKVIVTSTGVEHATAAYNAGITGDTNIQFLVIANKA